MGDLVEVLSTPNTAHAQLTASLLKDNGVNAVVLSSDLAAAIGIGSFVVPARVMVPKEQADEARAVMAVMQEVADDETRGATDPETCPACGKAWERGFEQCWNCQHELAAPPTAEG